MPSTFMVDALNASNYILWCAALVLAAMVFELTRQVAYLYRQVAPAGALMINQIIRVGEAAPVVQCRNSLGGKLQIGGKTEGRSCLLAFVSPICPVSKQLMTALKAVAANEKKWLDVVYASDGDEYDHNAFIHRHNIEPSAYLRSEALGLAYGVAKLPYAVIVDETGEIASMGIVNTLEHLNSLLESKERKVASIQEYMSRLN